MKSDSWTGTQKPPKRDTYFVGPKNAHVKRQKFHFSGALVWNPDFSVQGPKNVLPALLQKLVGYFFKANLTGNLGELGDFFGPTKQRLKHFGENFRAFLVRNFVARKNISCKLRSAGVPP